MDAPRLSHVFVGIQDKNEVVCTLTATVVVGFENIAQQECEEKLKVKCLMARGRLFFELPIERVEEVYHLRAVETVSLLLGDLCVTRSQLKGFPLSLKEHLAKLVESANWSKGVLLWQKMKNHRRHSKNDSVHNSDAVSRALKTTKVADESRKIDDLHFRVKCVCISGYFVPGSAESIAQLFGEAIQRRLVWMPDGDKSSLEVSLHVHEQYMYADILLVDRLRLHKKDLSLKPLLQPSTAYCLLRLAGLADGETVCNLMPGNSFQTEIQHVCPRSRVLNGFVANDDQTYEVWPSSNLNEVFQWDGIQLPLRDSSVDIVTTQAPVSSSYFEDNHSRTKPAFDSLLSELARVVKRQTGRAVLVTHRHNSMTLVVQKMSRLWRCSVATRCAGLGTIFCLARTIGRL